MTAAEKARRVLVGYMRVSKADGSQTEALQRDALLAAGAHPDRLYDDRASGRTDDRLGLVSCLKALREATPYRCGNSSGSVAIRTGSALTIRSQRSPARSTYTQARAGAHADLDPVIVVDLVVVGGEQLVLGDGVRASA